MKLLSTVNNKIKKGEKLGVLTFGLSLSPHTLSGKNFCSHASPGCAAACLNTAGMGAFSTVQAGRLAKSQYFIRDRAAFMAQLVKEIGNARKLAAKKKMRLAIRLNIVSDLPWENILVNGQNVMNIFPDVQFYDYTPNPKRAIQFANGTMPSNYHLTFSRKENNQSIVETIANMLNVKNPVNIAAVFSGKTLPATYLGRTVINGDESDARFLDARGVIVGLIAKGRGRKDKSGFVIQQG